MGVNKHRPYGSWKTELSAKYHCIYAVFAHVQQLLPFGQDFLKMTPMGCGVVQYRPRLYWFVDAL